MEALIDRLKDRGTRRNTDNITEQGRKDSCNLQLLASRGQQIRLYRVTCLHDPRRFHRRLLSLNFPEELAKRDIMGALLSQPAHA